MARYEMLNNVAHKDLRVATRFGASCGDDIGMVPAYPTEYAELVREYPIFFRKNEDGEYQSVVLLGFGVKENLFLDGEQWKATYLPAHIARGPFLIGFQEQNIDGELRTEAVITVDLDHPRVNFEDGEAAFLPQGGHSPYLEHVTTMLRGIRDGMEGGKAMYAAFDALDLIQPLTLDIKFDNEHGANVTGLLGIDRERLAALDAESLHSLHRSGYLEGAYLVLASMHNMRRLMAEKQRRLSQDAVAANAG
jgi:hypothetical protein